MAVLDWLLDFLQPNCSRLVFVLSPDGRSTVREELERRLADARARRRTAAASSPEDEEPLA